jgi:hypothetical protein
LRANGVDDRVVELTELFVRHVSPDLDVAEKAEPGLLRDLLVDTGDVLELRVIRRDAEAHEAPRRRQPLEHVHLGALLRIEEVAGRIERSGA